MRTASHEIEAHCIFKVHSGDFPLSKDDLSDVKLHRSLRNLCKDMVRLISTLALAGYDDHYRFCDT